MVIDLAPASELNEYLFDLTISVADVELRIASESPLDCRFLPRFYREFLGPSRHEAQPLAVEIAIMAEAPPPGRGLTRVLEEAGSWAMYRRDAENYLLELAEHDSDGEILYQARTKWDCADVAVYRGKSPREKRKAPPPMINPVQYPFDQMLLIYRLAGRKGGIFEAVGVEIAGAAYLFVGQQHDGRSGLLTLLDAPRPWRRLSDRRVIIREVGETLTAFGTPWAGERGIAANVAAPLGGLIFVSSDDEASLRKIPPAEALHRLLPAAQIPRLDPPVMARILQFCEDISRRIPAYELKFSPGAAATDLIASQFER